MTLVDAWYGLVALTMAVYLVLDGFDLGAGALHLWLGRNDAERRAILRSIGPVWDANEVWLIAGGASLLLAFPTLFARSFSGFYLPLTFVLWLLLFRALGVELRHQLSHRLWTQLWDVAFSVASLLLILLYGAALGNIVRGVALDAQGDFFTPLWTSFRVDGQPGILDWYTLLVAVTALAALSLHGALWLGLRIEDPLRQRCAALAKRALAGTFALSALCGLCTFSIQPQLSLNLMERPLWLVAPVGAAGSLVWLLVSLRRGQWLRAFGGSCAYLVAMLASACAAIYPYALPPRGASPGLLLRAASANHYSLQVALYWWLPGLAIVTAYFVMMYRNLPRHIRVDDPEVH